MEKKDDEKLLLNAQKTEAKVRDQFRLVKNIKSKVGLKLLFTIVLLLDTTFYNWILGTVEFNNSYFVHFNLPIYFTKKAVMVVAGIGFFLNILKHCCNKKCL